MKGMLIKKILLIGIFFPLLASPNYGGQTSGDKLSSFEKAELCRLFFGSPDFLAPSKSDMSSWIYKQGLEKALEEGLIDFVKQIIEEKGIPLDFGPALDIIAKKGITNFVQPIVEQVNVTKIPLEYLQNMLIGLIRNRQLSAIKILQEQIVENNIVFHPDFKSRLKKTLLRIAGQTDPNRDFLKDIKMFQFLLDNIGKTGLESYTYSDSILRDYSHKMIAQMQGRVFGEEVEIIRDSKLDALIRLDMSIREWKNKLKKDLLTKMWEALIFNSSLTNIELAHTIKFLVQEGWHSYKISPTSGSDFFDYLAGLQAEDHSYNIVAQLVNKHKTLIEQEGTFELPGFVLPSDGNVNVVQTGQPTFLIQAIEAENPKMLAIVVGLGANVYTPSLRESLIEGPLVIHPIPLALYLFSQKNAGEQSKEMEEIVNILLKSADPSFRYSGEHSPESPRSEGLVKRIMNPVLSDKEGASDFLLVAEYGTADMVDLLIIFGHNIYAKDKNGKGVEDYAERNSRYKEKMLARLKFYAPEMKYWFSE